MPPSAADSLFAYGTLLLPRIVRGVVGRVPQAQPVVLLDFARYALRGRSYPAIVPAPGLQVQGLLYQDLTPAEMLALDAYEGSEYTRVEVQVVAPAQHWTTSCYVLRSECRELLLQQPWQVDAFSSSAEQQVLAQQLGLTLHPVPDE